jgi:hypothetical protein
MTTRRFYAVGVTLRKLAATPLGNDEMLRRVRERHPRTSLRDIVQAAMFVVTDPKHSRSSLTTRLYDFALSVRRVIGMS